LIEPLEALSAEHDVSVAYVNPNIHPAGEYRRRRDTLLEYAEKRGVETIEASYAPASWMRAVAGLEDDPEARCRACYRLRLGTVSRMAAERGHEAVATTLTVSPYQDPAAIEQAGRQAAEEVGVSYLHTDFRDRYRSAVDRSKDLGMYRQRYCGCLLSEIEAEEARIARRSKRG
jgi:predicted adenine nucleotide alpha hydrolase (AANH) superfamily ATPase